MDKVIAEDPCYVSNRERIDLQLLSRDPATNDHKPTKQRFSPINTNHKSFGLHQPLKSYLPSKLDQTGFPSSANNSPRSCPPFSTAYLQQNSSYNILFPSHILYSPSLHRTTTHFLTSPSCSPKVHTSGSSHVLPCFLSAFISDPTDNLGSESSQHSFISLLHLGNIFLTFNLLICKIC